jgi:hypothetical protein
MKKLLFGAVIGIIVVSPAFAGGGRDDGGETCKACPSWRSPASSNAPPVMGLIFGAYPYGPMPPLQGEKADTLSPKTKQRVHKR